MSPQFRLSDETDSLGLSCTRSGVLLAGAPLLRKTALGLAARPKAEIGALMKAAYGDAFGEVDLSPRLAVVAEALNKGDLGRARIAALQMRLPELSWDRAIRVARTEESLTKYDPDEPRDWRGRWTTANSGAPPNPMDADARQLVPPSTSPSNLAPSIPSGPTGVASGPAHLYGGRLIHTGGGIGDNEPPLDPVPIPEAEPDLPGVRVPEGWDRPGYTIGGLYYPPTRIPTLASGKLWPQATHDNIKQALALTSGSKPPMVVIYVPIDRIGPELIGETRDEDYDEPKGYISVKLIGTPQYTQSRGAETNHARDSIIQALAYAYTGRYSEIYFNSAISTSTRGEIMSPLRPDLMAVARPDIETEHPFTPYEIYSPRQDSVSRTRQFNLFPKLRTLQGHYYKFLLMLGDYLKKIGY